LQHRDIAQVTPGNQISCHVSKARLSLEPDNDALWSDVVLPIGYDSADTNAPVNAALGKPVIASGPTWPGLPKENLTDGNLTSFTHCAVPEPASWFLVDLGATYALDHLELFNRTDGCCPERLSNFTVSILADDDGQPGDGVWSADIRTDGSNSGVGGKDVVRGDLDHDGIFAGRWIRVQSRPDSGDRYFQIAELRAFVFTSGSGYAPLIRSDVGQAMKGVSGSAFLRIPFEIAPADSIERTTLRLHYDDGFIAFVNGKEIARRNARLGPPLPNGTAMDFHSGLLTETFDVPANWFHPGANVLAFQGLNVVASDRDFLLFPELNRISTTTGNPGYFKNPSPGDFNGTNVVGFVASPQMSAQRGFFDAPFEVVVWCSTPGSTLVYTTNSSQPSLTNGIQASAASGNGFPAARIQIGSTTVLRAAAFKDGLEPAPIQTQSYLFLDAVLQQPKRPADVPASWAGFAADYEMDPRVVTNAAYQAEIRPGLRSIPTLSIVLAPDDLFGSTRGIYIFPEQIGDAWERRASIEWIRPDGTSGFQADCGIRVWGTGWRSHAASLKHAFQLKFKDDYGPRRLDYPLFPNTPMASFDHLVLRAQGSRSWNDFRQPDIEQTQYIHDAWARDTARAMGKLDGDATFVHLYLNGLYWGLYNPVEKTDESFASDYFGGEKEDFDVITSRFNPEADAGDLQVWNEMMALANAGLSTADAYARLEQLLDIDDFCDYMLLNIYATNHDGPPSSGNNIRAIRRRNSEGRFRFFVWDMEWTFWDANENNLGGDADNTPTRIFQKLRANPEFRLRFADHAHRHLFNDGALTPIVARERWRARAKEIYTAVLGESARWGDARRPALPYTRNLE